MSVVLSTHEITLLAGERTLCRDLSISLARGERWGLLGRNGAGKTTLLHTLARLRRPAAGRIVLEGQALSTLSQGEIARSVGLLLQDQTDALPATVLETALLGHHPHAKSRLFDDDEDLQSARQALDLLGLTQLAARKVSTLSGGERQRLALATLLTQAPRLLLLDEPSNHLDLGFQSTLVSLLRAATEPADSDAGATLLMATHDINLAARLCNRIILMDGKGAALAGTASEILTLENLTHAYDCEIRAAQGDGRTLFYPA